MRLPTASARTGSRWTSRSLSLHASLARSDGKGAVMSVTPDKIAVALGRTAPDPDSPLFAQWEMWIADAMMLIEAKRAKVKPSAVLDEAKVDYVVRESVVAQVKKPDDATQVTTQIDDGMISKAYKSSSGRVSIRDEWWELLGLVDTSSAFHVDTAPSFGSAHLPWCSLAFGAAYCSCGVDIAGVPIFETGDDDAGR